MNKQLFQNNTDYQPAMSVNFKPRDFHGLSKEHLTEMWKVYVWVAMKNKCFQKRNEQCSLKLFVTRLNQLNGTTLGERAFIVIKILIITHD